MKARPAEAVVQRARVIARIVYRVTDRNPGWREETVESLEAESLEVESLALYSPSPSNVLSTTISVTLQMSCRRILGFAH
jgi:hypothetical protein